MVQRQLYLLQVGQSFSGLEVVRYCSHSNCQQYLGNQATAKGICTTFNGADLSSDISPQLLRHQEVIARFFSLPPERNYELKFANDDFFMLLDVHNSDISKSANNGSLSLKVGTPGSHVNQVTSHFVHMFLQTNKYSLLFVA